MKEKFTADRAREGEGRAVTYHRRVTVRNNIADLISQHFDVSFLFRPETRRHRRHVNSLPRASNELFFAGALKFHVVAEFSLPLHNFFVYVARKEIATQWDVNSTVDVTWSVVIIGLTWVKEAKLLLMVKLFNDKRNSACFGEEFWFLGSLCFLMTSILSFHVVMLLR